MTEPTKNQDLYIKQLEKQNEKLYNKVIDSQSAIHNIHSLAISWGFQNTVYKEAKNRNSYREWSVEEYEEEVPTKYECFVRADLIKTRENIKEMFSMFSDMCISETMNHIESDIDYYDGVIDDDILKDVAEDNLFFTAAYHSAIDKYFMKLAETFNFVDSNVRRFGYGEEFNISYDYTITNGGFDTTLRILFTDNLLEMGDTDWFILSPCQSEGMLD